MTIFASCATTFSKASTSPSTGRMLPYTVFIDPQLGRIGITEKEARQQGIKIRVAKMPMTSVARAREFGETRGLMKIIVDPQSEADPRRSHPRHGRRRNGRHGAARHDGQDPLPRLTGRNLQPSNPLRIPQRNLRPLRRLTPNRQIPSFDPLINSRHS